ncbi:NC domain protein [Scytonema sp. UIC 10036]|uniref:lecithin retinol acyltransferase family protein n=1 Tax=Scytonema sp. UIC 10036 TaxID=2304196 RepID=UPI0012DA29C0|nr:lecithin retinol acyltransferase family protein [Scytonema sp. UIC 10036]MUH01803.1 NC domain protein [Scytonema sp. UIC 10036]
MTRGDHIYVSFFFDGFPVTHHGIDCGDGYIIHYDMQRVSIIPKHRFGKGRKIHIKEYGNCGANDIVVQRAKSKLYEKAYNVFFNNCEHFAYYCKTGQHKSEQVKKFGAISGGVVAGSIVGLGTQLATQQAAKVTVQAISPISQTIINTAIQQAPTVAGSTAGSIAGLGSFVSSVTTDLVVRKVLEDDENLPKRERNARKNARRAGRFASTAAGVAGTLAAVVVGGSSAVALGVAAPAILGIGIGLLTYYIVKSNPERTDALSPENLTFSN